MAEFVEHDTVEEDLVAQLPAFMPKDDESGNYKLLAPIAAAVKNTKDDIETVDRSLRVQHADTIEELDKLAAQVGLQSRQGESIEHYRARIMAEFHAITSEGTVANLLDGIAAILDIEIEKITYTETHTSSGGSARISVPLSKLDALALSNAEFRDIVDGLMPASYRLDVYRSGTFTYISETDYNDGTFTHDTTKGYDGLDTNGDPKDTGGTYAGVL
jgi:hypothetical protein